MLTDKKRVELGMRVKKGAAVLDRREPGWAQKIDVDLLDLKDSHHCVLGQLWGDGPYGFTTPYILKARLLFGFDECYTQGALCGFQATDREIRNQEHIEIYEALTALWRDEIRTRVLEQVTQQ